MRPVAQPDRHDGPRLVDELVDRRDLAGAARPWPSGMLAPIQTCRPRRKLAPMRMDTAQPPIILSSSPAAQRKESAKVISASEIATILMSVTRLSQRIIPA